MKGDYRRIVTEMIGELHNLGYGWFKLSCYRKHGGGWRHYVHVGTFINVCMTREQENEDGVWGSHGQYLIIEAENAKDAALKFIQKYPSLANRAKGEDCIYMEWYREMLGMLSDNPRDRLLMNHIDYAIISDSTVLHGPFIEKDGELIKNPDRGVVLDEAVRQKVIDYHWGD